MPFTPVSSELGYLRALEHIRKHGADKSDRTGTGTRSIFGDINLYFPLMYDNRPILPLLTTKKIYHRSFIHELIWMLSGDSNVRYLKANDVSIWDSWVIAGTEEYRMATIGERIRQLKDEQLAAVREKQKEMAAAGAKETTMLAELDIMLNRYGISDQILKAGDLGPVYGKQWRAWEDMRKVRKAEWSLDSCWFKKRGFKFEGELDDGEVLISRTIDQIALIEDALKNNPDSRRIVLSAWNVSRIEEMALPPCHTLAQWGVENGELHCKLYQRSGDFFLGVPFNFAFYALLTHMLASISGLRPGVLYHTIGDAHIYTNHIKQVDEQLSRDIIPGRAFLSLNTAGKQTVTDYAFDDIVVTEYRSHDAIPAPVAV